MRESRFRPYVIIITLALIAGGCALRGGDKAEWSPPAYYAEEHYAEIEGINICYLEAGQENEQAIVFVHGWSGNIQNWWDQFEYFKDKYHVVVFDNPGHGKSERSSSIDYSMPKFAGVTVGLMDHLGIERAVLVGNSMGGHIAAQVAITWPERVDKLVLSDSAGAGRLYWTWPIFPFIQPQALKALGVTNGKQYRGQNEKDRARAEFTSSFKGTDQEGLYLQALKQCLYSLAHDSIRGDLKTITAPTLLIWGDNDTTVSPDLMKVFSELIPDTTSYLVHNGGHTPNMQVPGEFNCVIDTFIKGRYVGSCKPK